MKTIQSILMLILPEGASLSTRQKLHNHIQEPTNIRMSVSLVVCKDPVNEFKISMHLIN